MVQRDTDPRGRNAYSMKLGMSRAEAVEQHLASKGVSEAHRDDLGR